MTTDTISGASTAWLGFDDSEKVSLLLDTLVVWRIDRLDHSLKDLIDWVVYLKNQGVAYPQGEIK